MAEEQAEMSLRDYGNVVRRRKWVVIAAAVLSTIVALLLSAVQTPIYSADAQVLIQPRGEDALFETEVRSVNDRSIQTEIQVIEGVAVRNRVQENLQLDSPPPEANASAVGDTDVIRVTVRDANATNAATYANSYVEAYIEIRREQAVGDLLAASAEVQNSIDQLEVRINELDEDDPLRASLVAQQASFTTTLDQLLVDAALRTGGAVIIKTAEIPASPVEPTPARSAVLAGVIGLMIGIGAAFLIDYLDDHVRTVEDVEAITDRPVLVEVPVDPPPDNRPISISEPMHPSTESYRGLRTNIQFVALDREMRVLLVTSSIPGEGKTSTSSNLAVVLARSGHRVALVDADLRRPRVHTTFDLPQTPGLTELLLGTDPKDVVNHVEIGQNDRMSVYTSGVVPSNPSELLSSRRVTSLLNEMGNHYDYVVVDSAPILPVSDSIALSGNADGVIVVVHSGRVSRGNMADTMERLERVSAPVVGVVLNQAVGSRAAGYVYGEYGTPSSNGQSALDDAIEDSVSADV